MRLNVKVKDVVTINTDTESQENQPMVEFTLEVRKDGSPTPREIKFTEMLCNLAGMNAVQIANHMAMLIEDYVKTAIKGQTALNPKQEWVEKSRLIGSEYTFDF